MFGRNGLKWRWNAANAMEPEHTAPDIIRKVLSTGTYSADELDHLYRYLSKKTHPDLTGNDGEAFIRLRETYLRAREQLHLPGSQNAPPFDPFRIIAELGFEAVPAPRINLYILLRRFFQAGFHNRKIRNRSSSLRRAAEILEAIGYWSDRYSPQLKSIINGYLDRGADFMNTTKQFRDFSFGRRLFIQGTDLFFRFQSSGKEGTRSLAEEKLTLSAVILRKTTGGGHPLTAFGQWFLEELEKPPVLIEGL